MSDNFKALIVNQEGENFTREVKSIDKSFLKHGDVTCSSRLFRLKL